MQDHEVLDKAADLIDQHGWIQGTWGDPQEGFCTEGAINYALFGVSLLPDGKMLSSMDVARIICADVGLLYQRSRIMWALRAHLTNGVCVARWNDRLPRIQYGRRLFFKPWKRKVQVSSHQQYVVDSLREVAKKIEVPVYEQPLKVKDSAHDFVQAG